MTPEHEKEFKAWQAENKQKQAQKKEVDAGKDAKKKEAVAKQGNIIRLRSLQAQERGQLDWNQKQERYTMRQRHNMEKLRLMETGAMPQEPDLEPYTPETAPF